jgi:hypothetical protein
MGCQQSPLGAEVAGVVTLDGKQLDSGSIVFTPSEGQGNNAFGAVDASGSYFLKSNRTIGLAPGKYKASVAAYERVEVAPGERSMIEPKLITPQKYRDINSSGLEFEVVPGQNSINIELSSQ